MADQIEKVIPREEKLYQVLKILATFKPEHSWTTASLINSIKLTMEPIKDDLECIRVEIETKKLAEIEAARKLKAEKNKKV